MPHPQACTRCKQSFSGQARLCLFCGTSAKTEKQSILPGLTLLRRFVVEKYLWQDAFGIAYLAQDPTSGRRVLLRKISVPFSHAHELISRARRDGPRFQSLKHLALPSIISTGVSEDGSVVIASEYHPGKTLAERLYQKETLTLENIVSLLRPVSEGLEMLYQEGFLHGAISPTSIVFPDKTPPAVQLLDIGTHWFARLRVERLKRPENAMGAWPYLAPEVWREPKSIDARTDVYALSAISFYILSGKPPYLAKDAAGFMSQHCFEWVPPLVNLTERGFPAEVEDIIRKGLSKKKEERFETPLLFAQAFFEATKGPGPSEVQSDATRVISLIPSVKELTKVIPQTVVISRRKRKASAKEGTRRGFWPVILLLLPFFITILLAVLFQLGILGGSS